MPKGIKSNSNNFIGFDNGKVSDKGKNTVHSPNQIDKMYEASLRDRKKQGSGFFESFKNSLKLLLHKALK